MLKIIEAGLVEQTYWRDVFNYRELMFILAWRDIAVRYKQTIFGIAWSLIRPLIALIVFTIVFGKFAQFPSPVPYALLVISGLIPFQFLSTSLTECSMSLIGNERLISKVYFPRVLIPFSTIIATFVDLFISFGLMIALMVWYQFIPTYKIIFAPLFLILAAVTACGAGLWLCALTVKFRDFRYIVPFIVQLGFFISPVGFSSFVVPEKWQLIYSFNPIVGIINGFRWSTLSNDYELNLTAVIISIIVTILLLVSGIRYFRKTEKSFADII